MSLIEQLRSIPAAAPVRPERKRPEPGLKRIHSITIGRYLRALTKEWQGVKELEKKLYRHPHSITKFMRTNEEILRRVETKKVRVGVTTRVYWRLK